MRTMGACGPARCVPKAHSGTESWSLVSLPIVACMQVKALTSLEVARQRQSNRAQLHLGQQPQGQAPSQQQSSGLLRGPEPFQRPGLLHNLGQSKPVGLPQVPGQQKQSSEGTAQGEVAGPAQLARAKLEAIRNELGNHQSVCRC